MKIDRNKTHEMSEGSSESWISKRGIQVRLELFQHYDGTLSTRFRMFSSEEPISFAEAYRQMLALQDALAKEIEKASLCPVNPKSMKKYADGFDRSSIVPALRFMSDEYEPKSESCSSCGGDGLQTYCSPAAARGAPIGEKCSLCGGSGKVKS